MLLHFIFVVKKQELEDRKEEFEYVKKMAQFFKVWIKEVFAKDVEIQCDEMVTTHRGLFQRLDTHTLMRDHNDRGKDTYHFYLSHFRPTWTDCTCEGYTAENFGMILWQKPKDDNPLFLQEKNCTTVSHELSHEFLRQAGYKRYMPDVHDVWMQHFHNNLPFIQYDEDFKKTDDKPSFLTIDLSSLKF